MSQGKLKFLGIEHPTNVPSNTAVLPNAKFAISFSNDDDYVCAAVYSPICGKNGRTYSNNCEAERAGIKIAYKGECEKPITESRPYPDACERIWELEKKCKAGDIVACNTPRPKVLCPLPPIESICGNGICEPSEMICVVDAIGIDESLCDEYLKECKFGNTDACKKWEVNCDKPTVQKCRTICPQDCEKKYSEGYIRLDEKFNLEKGDKVKVIDYKEDMVIKLLDVYKSGCDERRVFDVPVMDDDDEIPIGEGPTDERTLGGEQSGGGSSRAAVKFDGGSLCLEGQINAKLLIYTEGKPE